MPQAVTHVLASAIAASVIRDKNKKDKKKFPLHYVLISGLAGLLPDLDVIAFWVLYFFGFTIDEVHRSFTHTIFIPLIFLAL
ncbi:MAG: metal-dependent hydrolase, partial [Nanoarchaeota archaeon]